EAGGLAGDGREEPGVELLLVERATVGTAGDRRQLQLDAARALEVGLAAAGEHDADVAGLAPARRREEGIDRLTVVRGDEARGRLHSLVAQGLLASGAEVDLAGGRGADVVALAAELAEVAHRIRARGDGLRLLGLELVEDARTHLRRDDAAEVVLD